MSENIEKVESVLSDVSAEECFWATNGAIIKNLKELEPSIESMSEEVFRNHVNKEKNDFSDWVRDVIKDGELAAQLSKIRDKTRTQLLIVKRVLQLQS